MVAYADSVSMNGLYNGYMNSCHRAAIPNPLLVNVAQINNRDAVQQMYVLNIKSGLVQCDATLNIFTAVLVHY